MRIKRVGAQKKNIKEFYQVSVQESYTLQNLERFSLFFSHSLYVCNLRCCASSRCIEEEINFTFLYFPFIFFSLLFFTGSSFIFKTILTKPTGHNSIFHFKFVMYENIRYYYYYYEDDDDDIFTIFFFQLLLI